MVKLTMQVPDELAKRIKPIRFWLPTILELSLVGFKSLATETAAELIQFLSTNPASQEVLDYHASERAQARLRRLLTLNEAGLLSEAEQVNPMASHRMRLKTGNFLLSGKKYVTPRLFL